MHWLIDTLSHSIVSPTHRFFISLFRLLLPLSIQPFPHSIFHSPHYFIPSFASYIFLHPWFLRSFMPSFVDPTLLHSFISSCLNPPRPLLVLLLVLVTRIRTNMSCGRSVTLYSTNRGIIEPRLCHVVASPPRNSQIDLLCFTPLTFAWEHVLREFDQCA